MASSRLATAMTWSDGTNQNGVMADEAREVYPNAVTTGEDGFDRVDYAQITEPVEYL